MSRPLTLADRLLDAVLGTLLDVADLADDVADLTFGTSYKCVACGLYVESKGAPDGWHAIIKRHKYAHDRCPTHCPACGLSLAFVMGDPDDAPCVTCRRVDGVNRYEPVAAVSDVDTSSEVNRGAGQKGHGAE